MGLDPNIFKHRIRIWISFFALEKTDPDPNDRHSVLPTFLLTFLCSNTHFTRSENVTTESILMSRLDRNGHRECLMTLMSISK